MFSKFRSMELINTKISFFLSFVPKEESTASRPIKSLVEVGIAATMNCIVDVRANPQHCSTYGCGSTGHPKTTTTNKGGHKSNATPKSRIVHGSWAATAMEEFECNKVQKL